MVDWTFQNYDKSFCLYLLDFLPTKDLPVVACLCKSWNTVFENQKLWENLYRTRTKQNCNKDTFIELIFEYRNITSWKEKYKIRHEQTKLKKNPQNSHSISFITLHSADRIFRTHWMKKYYGSRVSEEFDAIIACPFEDDEFKAQAWLQKGMLYKRQRRKEMAKICFTESLQLDSHMRKVLQKHMNDLHSIGWLKQAVTIVRKQIQSMSSIWKAHPNNIEDKVLRLEQRITEKMETLKQEQIPKKKSKILFSISDNHCQCSMALAKASMCRLPSRGTWRESKELALRAYEKLQLGKKFAAESFEIGLETRGKDWSKLRRVKLNRLAYKLLFVFTTLFAWCYIGFVLLLQPFAR